MMEWRGRRRQQQEEEGGWWGPTNRHSGKKYGRQPPLPAADRSTVLVAFVVVKLVVPDCSSVGEEVLY
ncbi:hypothetical protein MUK42_33629 [Musa troglodytarum]|uniref:Uncharacterized protein n=1 Tax=Musa troglodytarum TaxID=320322 RepID=A0A9E7EGI2_9LILI|nr:hypothetical protein MUK42_33629 [Musa troglodytarum]